MSRGDRPRILIRQSETRDVPPPLAGMDLGAGLVLVDGVTGLAVDIRVRRLLVHEAEGFAETGMSISVSCNPTPSTPLGFTARVSPAWGGNAMSGAGALGPRDDGRHGP